MKTDFLYTLSLNFKIFKFTKLFTDCKSLKCEDEPKNAILLKEMVIG